MGRKAPAAAANGDGAAPASSVPSAASIAGSAAAEPFAWEAKHTTEMRLLSREVRLVLEGVDKYENLFATVYAPPPPTAPEGTPEESMAEVLVKSGYAKVRQLELHTHTHTHTHTDTCISSAAQCRHHGAPSSCMSGRASVQATARPIGSLEAYLAARA